MYIEVLIFRKKKKVGFNLSQNAFFQFLRLFEQKKKGHSLINLTFILRFFNFFFTGFNFGFHSS